MGCLVDDDSESSLVEAENLESRLVLFNLFLEYGLVSDSATTQISSQAGRKI